MIRKGFITVLGPVTAALMLFFAAGCASTTVNTALTRPQAGGAPPAAGASIAVIPFENLSTSRNAGLAVTDLATSILYASGYFQVVEVSGLQDDADVRFRRFDLSPWERQLGVNTTAAAAAGRAAQADYVLAGSVGEYGFIDGFGEAATVGITVRLVRSSNAQVLWAGSLSRHASSLAFSEESAHRLAHEVMRELLGRMLRDLQRNAPASGKTDAAG
jgi:TolB-like protein